MEIYGSQFHNCKFKIEKIDDEVLDIAIKEGRALPVEDFEFGRGSDTTVMLKGHCDEVVINRTVYLRKSFCVDGDSVCIVFSPLVAMAGCIVAKPYVIFDTAKEALVYKIST